MFVSKGVTIMENNEAEEYGGMKTYAKPRFGSKRYEKGGTKKNQNHSTTSAPIKVGLRTSLLRLRNAPEYDGH